MNDESNYFSHLLFNCPACKLPYVPKCSGIYFLSNKFDLYVGCAEDLQVRMPKSIKEKGIEGEYAFIPIPEFKRLSIIEIESEIIVSIFSLMYLNRLEERYNINLLNKTHRHLLPAAAWNPLYFWRYKYQISIAQTVLMKMGVPPELVTLKMLEPLG